METCTCQTIFFIAFPLQMELINASRENLVHQVVLDFQEEMDFQERWERKVILFQSDCFVVLYALELVYVKRLSKLGWIQEKCTYS